MYEFRTRDELEKFIQGEVVTAAEAEEILGVTRQTLHSLKERLKLFPIIERGRVTLYWKADILQRKKDLAKE
ncbi:MAG: DNA-binding protein [Negativicutes bacterium]|nr:DNA-binding protein [Negativicutes bacterium]